MVATNERVFEAPLGDGPEAGLNARQALNQQIQEALPDRLIASYDRTLGDRVQRRVVAVASTDSELHQAVARWRAAGGAADAELFYRHVPAADELLVPYDRIDWWLDDQPLPAPVRVA